MKFSEVIHDLDLGDAYRVKRFLEENPKYREATVVQEGLITYNFPVEYHYEYSWVIDLNGKLYNVLINEGHWYYRTRSRKEVKICRYHPEGTPKRTRRVKRNHEYNYKRPWELNKGSGKYRNDCQIWTVAVCLGISYEESYELLAAKGWSETNTGNESRNDWKGIFASKAIYLEKTIEYAEREFARMEEMEKWREVDWCKHFGLEPQPVNVGTRGEFLSFPKNFYNTKQSRTYYRLRDGARRAILNGKEAHLKMAEQAALHHYEDSIVKLANRIVRKGLNQDSISVKDSSIGENINTTISDGVKTVKAYTIVASGPIIAPHYRYLIT